MGADSADPENGTAELAELAALRGFGGPASPDYRQVVDSAVRFIHGARLAALALREGDEIAVTASTEAVRGLEQDQHRTGEGPAVDALAARHVVRSVDLAADGRWPRFTAPALRHGLRGVLAVPVERDGTVLGVVTAYATEPGALAVPSGAFLARYAAWCAVAVNNIRVLADAGEQVERLKVAMQSRSVIDQAIGILHARSGLSVEDAFARLRQISNRERVKLAVVATDIVEQAVRRSAARHRPES